MKNTSSLDQKMVLKTAVFMLFCLFIGSMRGQDAQQYFEKGNAAYEAENYQEAIDAYTEVLEQKQESAALYYNLANANYKLNRIAPSIYYYERALQLKPGDADIKNNLIFAQNMTIDAITPLPQNTFSKWYRGILNLFTLDGWAIAAVVLILLFTVCFIIYCFVYFTIQKRIFFTTSCITFLLGLTALFFAFRSQTEMDKNKAAIVFSPTAEVRQEPRLSSEEAFVLHEGTKVSILSVREDWSEIRLADGKEGWIPKTAIKFL